MINNPRQLNMIIGYPLEHSLTPMLHNTVYKLLNLNSVMLAHATQDLGSTIHALKTLAAGCIAVTMPYKQTILPYLDSMSDEVKKLQSTNTVICRSGKLTGFNTDIDGIRYALRDIPLANKNVLLIGAGGAAHAAAYYLQQNQTNLFYLNRTQDKTMKLITQFGGNKVNVNNINEFSYDLIINATPVGMFPNNDDTPLPGYPFHAKQIVFDMVYNPVNTTLIKAARSQGAMGISGLDMFLAQGLKQIELLSTTAINKNKLIPILKNELELVAASEGPL